MRLKEVLPHIIGQEQGAFIPGRSIHSHLLLVQEMMHSLKYGCGRKALMAAKVDLESAYDSIEWEGLFQILRYFQFPDRWIRWVKACVSTTRVAILVNGTPTEWIPVERGLRQGDPLSPYLFAIVVEALSAKLRIVQRSGMLHGNQPDARLLGAHVPEGISHVLYADDLLVVSSATPLACDTLRTVFEEVRQFTRLKVNWGKSSVRFSPSVPCRIQKWMSRILHMKLANGAWKYLGVQVMDASSRRRGVDMVIEKAHDKLTIWKSQLLTMAGRIQLIKAVMSMLPQHLLMAAAMSGKGLGQLEKLMRQFLWIQQSGRKIIHLICWDNVTKPKQEGGLGLQKMKDLRIAILGMLAYRFLLSNSYIQPLFALKYKWSGNPWEISKNPKGPPI
ncbi:hypothetical protein QJS10_CPB17g00048 [Acorus calamus]|uniref:Reverse transcriptase domain-containing protein n=1 Tax=Acorus calamus TaxID=4465 RepID=A0AAV9CR30_ACOCL|nr:hypothetical protein QJS10_CPB17g00048 [Acorus calamus]